VVQGVILFLAVGYVVANLAVDILYSYLDPRIRVH
jgi:peptide/nickel transport system permease protein